MQRRHAGAMSVDIDPGLAAGEVIGAVLEQLGGQPPDLAVLFVSGAHVEHLGDLVAAIDATIHPATTLAVSAAGVLGGAREVERGPAVSLWAGLVGSVRPLRIEAFDARTLVGVPDELRSGETVLLLADPFSFPVESFFEALPPGVGVVGGLASAGSEPGGNQLWLDGRRHRDGAVGVVLPAGVGTPLVSQGCRPIGVPWVVTRADGNVIIELAGRQAAERVESLLASLSTADRLAGARGLHIGVVVNEQREEFGPSDVLIRNVLGFERTTNGVAVGDVIEPGQVVQFQVRDPDGASAELARIVGAAQPLDGALVFTCNHRGTSLFGEPHHDAATIEEFTEGGLAGMFCAGEIGPVGPRNALHGLTATVLAFGELPCSR